MKLEILFTFKIYMKLMMASIGLTEVRVLIFGLLGLFFENLNLILFRFVADCMI